MSYEYKSEYAMCFINFFFSPWFVDDRLAAVFEQ